MYNLRKLFLLDPSVTFLNHGSFGATPKLVFDEYQRWQRELENQPVEFLGRRYTGLMAEFLCGAPSGRALHVRARSIWEMDA